MCVIQSLNRSGSKQRSQSPLTFDQDAGLAQSDRPQHPQYVPPASLSDLVIVIRTQIHSATLQIP